MNESSSTLRITANLNWPLPGWQATIILFQRERRPGGAIELGENQFKFKLATDTGNECAPGGPGQERFGFA